MAISNNIAAKVTLIIAEQQAWENDNTVLTPVSTEIEEKATNAILGGVLDWVAYVSLFSKSSDELARLMPTTGTSKPEKDRNQARAYLAADGMCGMGTGRKLGDRVTVKLD